MAHPGMQKYEAIVVDNDMAARMRLKAATASVANFGQVRLVGSVTEALGLLQSSGHVDIIFISKRFEQDSITSMISSAKESSGGQDSAYVLLLTAEDQESDTVAKNVLGGADGFLLEPYSVDQLVEITELAARVKRERSQEREAAALKFLVEDVRKQVDRVWYLKSNGFDVGRHFKKLRELCQVFQTLEKEVKEIYFEVVITAFHDCPMPAMPAKDYKGVSGRVKKRMEQKVLAQMEVEIAQEDMSRLTNKK